jgi:hypothetical protein
MLFILPVIPTFFLVKHSHFKFAIILLVSFWGCFLISVISRRVLNFLYKSVISSLRYLGNKAAKIALFLVYILSVVPIGFLMKITKRDRLKLKKNEQESYWEDYNNNDSDYSYQF